MDTVEEGLREILHSPLLIQSKEEPREGMVLQTQMMATWLNLEVSDLGDYLYQVSLLERALVRLARFP